MGASDWAIVGYGDDPIPDDPGIVAAQVEHIKAVAADIAAQVAALPGDGQVNQIRWQSSAGDAPDEFKQVVKKLPKDLDLLHTRYQKVGAAMDTFQHTLVRVKSQADGNLPIAVGAHQQMLQAQQGIQQMQDFQRQAQQAADTASAHAAPGAPPAQPATWTGPDWSAQLSSAQQTFNHAKGQIDDAVNHFRSASSTAAQAVNAASQDSLKNDTSIWGDITHVILSGAHWVATHVPLQAISAVLNKISAIAGIVALVASVIPVIGDAVAAVALAVGAAAAVGAFIADGITQLNNVYEGTFSWSNCAITMGLDALNVGLSIAGIGAFRSMLAAKGALETASTAVKSADAAATSARAAETMASRAASVDSTIQRWATTGSWLRRIPVRLIFGDPSTLDSAATASASRLAAASAASQAAQAQLRAAEAAQTLARTQLSSVATTSARVGVAGLAGGTGGLGWTEQSANPISWVSKTPSEISHLAHWDDDPTGSHAMSVGSQLVAQPIKVPAGG